MANDTEFARILGWIDRLNSSVAAAKQDQVSMHNLVSSAEYELQQLHRHLSTVKRAEPKKPAPIDVGPIKEGGSIFAMKLRHPDSIKHGWWAV